MRNIKLTIAYDGTDFHGWQRQPGLPTVQEARSRPSERITGSPARTRSPAAGPTPGSTPAGRSSTSTRRRDSTPDVIVRALNAMLPPTVRVLDADDVPQAFHATLDATSKRYRYVLDNARIADPFRLRYCWHVAPRLDDRAMHRAAQALQGRHDFRSFETDWPNRTSSVRTIFDVEARREGDVVLVEVEADGFLYNMVRSIAGTLVLVGHGRRAESFAAEALAALRRKDAGPTAPPQGLFLLHVRYDRTTTGATDPCRSSTSSPA